MEVSVTQYDSFGTQLFSDKVDKRSLVVIRAVSGDLSYANSFIAIDDTVNFQLTDAVPNLLFWNMTHTLDQAPESIIGLIPVKSDL